MDKNKYTKKAKDSIEAAKKVAKDMGHGAVGSEHLLIGLMQTKEALAREVLLSNGVKEDELFKLIGDMMGADDIAIVDSDTFTPRAQRVIDQALKEAARFGSKLAGTEHILIAILKERDSVAERFLSSLNADSKNIYYDLMTAMGQDAASAAKEDFPTMGQERTDSATPTLDKYSRDLTLMAVQQELDPVIGRDIEVERVIQILNRRGKNNPCLIGDPGVGKTAIVEGIAQRIVSGQVPATIENKRLVSLDLSGMVAGSKYRGEFEDRLKTVISEVIADANTLLFLDEIHTIIGAGNAEGAIDAANILKPALARGEIQLIGATTNDEYRKYIEKDAALERRFQPVKVEEPSEEETIEILKGLRSLYEDHHQVTITDDAIMAAVKLSRRYITDRFLPDKAIDLIDEASSKAQIKAISAKPKAIEKLKKELNELEEEKEKLIRKKDFEGAALIREEQKRKKKRIESLSRKFEIDAAKNRLSIGEEEVAEVVSMWTKIPLNKLTEKESSKLINLEKELHKRVIGQESAVEAVSRAIRRGRVGIGDPNRPVGSFMFLGPTGVGKTELSKALAMSLFGTEDSLIRVDMSEYMEKHTVSKLIGAPPGYVGYEEGGQLSEKVRRNPYSIVLFDEIEKAHPDVFNVLLQVLDDGVITDNEGRHVDFTNTIIIMTSNIGARNIVEPKQLGFETVKEPDSDYKGMKSKVMEDVKKSFRPEFINRIDEIIVFKQLSKEEVTKIADIMLKKLNKRAKEASNITITLTVTAKKLLVDKGYDIKYGARPLRRAIQYNIEDKLALKILDGEIKSGDDIVISSKNGDFHFDKKKK